MLVNRTAILFVFAIALGVGCEAKDRDTIASEGGKAWEHAAKAASAAWSSVSAKVAEITPDASADAMQAARSAVESAKQELAKIPNPTPEIQRQLESARTGLEKIDAAAMVRDLREKAAAALEAAKKAGAQAGESAKKAAKEAEELQDRLSKAQKSYEEAEARLRSLEAGK